MESALPILLFLGFLFGSTLLILICGIQRTEDEEGAFEANPAGPADLRSLPRFFGRPGEGSLTMPVMVVVDEVMAHQVEDFLRGELELAEMFVDDPTVERLHEQPDAAEAGPSVFDRLESYLRSEQRAVADFVSSPSVESLFGYLQPAGAPA